MSEQKSGYLLLEFELLLGLLHDLERVFQHERELYQSHLESLGKAYLVLEVDYDHLYFLPDVRLHDDLDVGDEQFLIAF